MNNQEIRRSLPFFLQCPRTDSERRKGSRRRDVESWGIVRDINVLQRHLQLLELHPHLTRNNSHTLDKEALHQLAHLPRPRPRPPHPAPRMPGT
eukprot:138470-Hanusia_phi.AAC.1